MSRINDHFRDISEIHDKVECSGEKWNEIFLELDHCEILNPENFVEKILKNDS